MRQEKFIFNLFLFIMSKKNTIKRLLNTRITNAIYSIFCYNISIFLKKCNKHILPFLFSIEPVDYCNLHCPECPTGNGSMTRPRRKMDLATFQLIIDKIKSHALYLTLYFQGEPLLNEQFEEMVKLAKSRHIYTATSTNAQLLDNARAEQIARSGLDKIIIDIDGTTQETYQQYRIGGELCKAIDAIRYLTEWKKKLHTSAPKIEMQFLVMKHNQHQIKEARRLAKTLKANRFTLKTAQLYDYRNGNERLTTIDQYARYKQTSNGLYQRKTARGICGRAFFGSVICVDGTVVPCSNDKNAQHAFGNLTTQSLQEIYSSPQAIAFRNNLLHNKPFDICKNCMR